MNANESCEEAGEGTMLVLPGLMCDFSMFEGLAALLPGLTAAADYGDEGNVTDMARRVLAAAPARFGLLGHSMGARVALEIWRLAPGRVSRLALVSTGVHPVRPGEAYKRYALADVGRTGGMEALVDTWLPPMVAPARRTDARLLAGLRDMCVRAGFERFLRQVGALLSRPDAAPLLPTIDCPLLVACGSEDGWSPPEQHRAIAAAVPQAHLSIVPGAGHMLPAEAPAALADILRDWIAATTPTASTYRKGRGQ